MRIKQHRPPYITGFENADVEFNSVDELLNIPFVKNFKEDVNFHRFSLSLEGNWPMLVAEYSEGHVWYVVGHIFPDESGNKISLPTWRPVYNKK